MLDAPRSVLILSLVAAAGCGESSTSVADAGPTAVEDSGAVERGNDGPPDRTDVGNIGITDPMGAVAKFCHQLRRSAGAIELTLEFGDPAIAKITARTDTCEPPAGQPCVVIPAGRVPLRLLEGTRVLGTRTVILQKGMEYGFEPVILPTTGEIVIEGGSLGSGRCASFAFPDAGAEAPMDGAVIDAGSD